MPEIRLTLAPPTRKALERGLRQTEDRGDARTAKHMMAMLAVAAGYGDAQIAALLHVSEEALRLWVKALM